MNTATKTTIVMGFAVMLIGASLAIGQSDGTPGSRQGMGGRGYRQPPPPPPGPYAVLHAPRIGEMLRSLNLTDEQNTKVREIRRGTMQSLREITDVEARREAQEKAMKAADKKIYDEVLTTEQKAKVDAALAEKKDIVLTDAQDKQIQEIMKAAHDKIYKEVLTDKQREAVDKAKEARPERRRGDGEGRPGRGGRGGGDGRRGPGSGQAPEGDKPATE